MTQLNWNIFRIKFHEREQAAFESLSYMLFCYEHYIKIGIFRFKNQTTLSPLKKLEFLKCSEFLFHLYKLTSYARQKRNSETSSNF
jgi:hypothetical protein